MGIDNATRLFVAAQHPKSFLSLDGADHLLTGAGDAVRVGAVIAAWAEKYGADDPLPAPPKPHKASNGVVVEETRRGKFQNHIVVGEHAFLADEPMSYGGDDSGPNPYELLNATLEACTSMTLRMYADRKKLPLEKVRIRLEHEKGPAEDCKTCTEDEKARVDIITKYIALEGDLDEATRMRLMEIADKCPVHRTLNAPVVIRSYQET